ncbi:MAG: hypothetical protein QOH91_1150 [Mycobacterium sp.]|jgi:hypothetical protein|nr:hypothetical protein [Mycobacterium sp.]
MSVVVVTRMKVRKWRNLPRFVRGSIATARQARRSPGFLGGRLRVEPGGAFWTLTVWECCGDMVAFRDSGIHAILVPRLAGWASEAVFGVWNSENADTPGWQEASCRVAAHPNFAPLDAPARAHKNGEVVPAQRLGLDLPIP